MKSPTRENDEVAVRVSDDSKLFISESRMQEAFGSTDPRFVSLLADQVMLVTVKNGETSSDVASFIFSVVEDIKPRDQVEAMLAAQMAAVHNAAMMLARRLNNVENIAQQDSAEKALNKQMRTYANQMEALRKYSKGGEQKVTVQHVSVNDGGQAVVGNVHPRGGVVEKTDINPVQSAHDAQRCTARSKRKTLQPPAVRG